jgi:hypothetical protein
MVLAITLATGTTACSRADGDPMPYEKVVDAVRSIAYEPDRLSELLGHRVVLDLRPFSERSSYYVKEADQISFRCAARGDDDGIGDRTLATVVDVEIRSNGVTTIILDGCVEARKEMAGTD